MASFREIQHKMALVKSRLVEYSSLAPGIVENILQYAKAVVHPGKELIDQHAFSTQMSTQFDFSNLYVICRMMRILKSKQFQSFLSENRAYEKSLNVEEFSLCVCTFLTLDKDVQINWVFAAYDSDEDGALSRQDLYCLLRPCILHAEDMDFEGETKDLVDIVMAVVDRNKNGEIDVEEFRSLVKRNVLYIDLLGQFIPSENVVRKFRSKIEHKTAAQVLDLFRNESILRDVQYVRREDPLYPIDLEFL